MTFFLIFRIYEGENGLIKYVKIYGIVDSQFYFKSV